MLTTEWNEFKQLDFDRINDLMRTKIIMDGRNLWDADKLRCLGFTYFGVGRATNGGEEGCKPPRPRRVSIRPRSRKIVSACRRV